MAVGKDPVLLLGVEEKAEDVEAEAVLLIGGSLIGADQQAAFHLRVSQKHDLNESRTEIESELAMEGAGPGRMGDIIVGLGVRLSLNQCRIKI
jgi:hypothetical protein